ncbi:tail fiber assembly protein [Salmonella enterica]|nr:tail fiber assembly protein [Salmonella enterica]EKJ0769187.1 tail fiber assembly protein [Salmonella enterica]
MQETEYYFDSAGKVFYPVSNMQGYIDAGMWPENGTVVSAEIYYVYGGTPPAGKTLSSNGGGEPVWVDSPPPSKEEAMAEANAERTSRINAANAYIGSKQWPGKAAIGRLKGEELAQYNLWLDYLDALEIVDTASAPDIKWPTPPGEQAS